MLIGRTLGRHIAFQLAKAILVIFIVFIALVTVVDFTQQSRWIGAAGLTLPIALLTSALRGPSLAETVLPFAVLFGAMITFVQLNRRLELTVTRAAGVSAWQVLTPTMLVTFLIGILTVLVYNPGAVALRDLSVNFAGVATSGTLDDGGPVWIRQNGNDGASIIGAERTGDDGARLNNVVAFLFAADGQLRLSLDAREALLVGNEWVFEEPLITERGVPAGRVDEFRIHTNLSLAQIRESLADPATVAFWRLPGLIEIASASALPATDLRMRFNTLLSLPFLLIAMVLIAAVVSLRFSRTLNLGRLVVTGAASGFVLYVVLVVSGDLGRGGIVAPEIAAWAPVLLSTLVSISFLLREEDG